MPENNQRVWISISLSIVGVMLGIVLLLTFFSGCTQQTRVSSNPVTNSPEQKVIFNDTMDNRIVLSHPAERIASEGRAINEMLIGIGAADKLVGVDSETNVRTDLKKNLRPDVKPIGSDVLDIEAIAQLHPDVLITFAWSKPVNIDKLPAMNCTPVYFTCQQLEILNDEAYALGELTGKQQGAQRYIRFNRKYQDLVESRLANIRPGEVLTVYGETSDNYQTTGWEYCEGQTLKALHTRNVYGNQSGAILSPEWLLSKDPDVIVKMSDDEVESLSSVYDAVTNRTGYKNMKAVQSDRVYIIRIKQVCGPRGVVGLVYLAKALYPERFADIDPDAVQQEYIQKFHTGDYYPDTGFYPPIEPVNVTSAGAYATVRNSSGG
jgi:iron complex transport system substrate-binding protein